MFATPTTLAPIAERAAKVAQLLSPTPFMAARKGPPFRLLDTSASLSSRWVMSGSPRSGSAWPQKNPEEAWRKTKTAGAQTDGWYTRRGQLTAPAAVHRTLGRNRNLDQNKLDGAALCFLDCHRSSA